MTDTGSLYRRIERRETRSSRSGLAITLAVIVILACAYAMTEMVLHLVDQPPLVSDMFGAATATAGLAGYPAGLVAAAGILTALIGAIIVIASLTSGRRARHLITTEKTAAVVDDAVVASALARHAAHAGNIGPDSVTVSVSHRTAIVRVTPASGATIDRGAVSAAVTRQLDSFALKPTVRARVVIEQGKVGA